MVMFPVLDEAQRLQYLQALGVTSWLPTQPLVGSQVNDVLWQETVVQVSNGPSGNDLSYPSSAPPSVLSLSEEASAPSPPLQGEGASQQQDTIDPQIQAAAVAEALGSLTEKMSSPHLSKSPKADSSLLAAEVERPRPLMPAHTDRLAPLHLGLSWYSNGVLVVNDIPVQEGAAMSSPIQRLQTAIVNTLRPALAETSMQVMPAASMEFNWPLVPGPHGDHSLIGAQSGLKYSLIKLLKDNSCSKLLVMGPAAIQLLKPEMSLGESSHIELSELPIQLMYSHSLHQLLAVPSLKEETWKHLQPLLNTPKTV